MNSRRFLLPAAAALVLVASTAVPAYAGTVTNGTVYTYVTAQGFNYTTSVPYWSVFAELPVTPIDDLNFYNSSFDSLGSSADPAGETNFVAVDSNYGTQPFQTYNATVPHYPGSGAYAVEVEDGSNIITIPTPTHQGTTGFSDPDLAFISLNDSQVVYISDIYLTAGESFWLSGQGTAESNVLLLEANPSNSSSFIQTRAAATGDQNTKVIDDCTLYTAEVTGWHGLVIFSNSWPTSSTQYGIGFGIHAFDPTDPAGYCPIADFPAATPAP